MLTLTWGVCIDKGWVSHYVDAVCNPIPAL
nr:MAG TPA: hypothetical protein [Caudoviricetes sp.]